MVGMSCPSSKDGYSSSEGKRAHWLTPHRLCLLTKRNMVHVFTNLLTSSVAIMIRDQLIVAADRKHTNNIQPY